MWASLLPACVPVLADETSLVDVPRVLAVRATPAESPPGGAVTLDALAADADGALADPAIDWAFCTDRKPLAELGPVARSCLSPGADGLLALGVGGSVDAVLPVDACSRFGPNPPPPVAGEPNGRPVDPDVTGGFHQPVSTFLGDLVTLGAVRLRCGVANVSQEASIAWNAAYHSNENPVIASFDVPASARVGEPVAVTVSWPSCPGPVCGDGLCVGGEDLAGCPADCAAPLGCGGAETYAVYDPDRGALRERREALSATWFSNRGAWDTARNGRGGDDEGLSLRNAWTPDAPGTAWIGVVLRDERGGVAFAEGEVEVAP